MKRRKHDIKTERQEALRGRILSLRDNLEAEGFGGSGLRISQMDSYPLSIPASQDV